ncbi:phenazine biosynthesis protein PhzF family [Pedococcus dokdonensis]|uniref:Phenazine biosynthesis protein PhzF family n=1 Tax=Pedococcus dokdonensis TaxID=443156 RepID=A0A1H0NNJ8_9MICO|nr:PhzF family phenazine biosynthesis protein [Pedococcus dokdonensis]SDO94253.1 phenazine biosynthesis protein PhzF family [Pedococcus dokdonensis]
MRLRYRLLNVFAHADDPFSGNPLCVFEDGSQLSDEQMLGLARQFNLSETTFLVPPADGADAGVRIFTTSFEMPFAGHPTLGTAHVARELHGLGDTLGLSMPAGTIPVTADGERWTLTANRGRIEADLVVEDVAQALGLMPEDLVGPVQQVSVGTSQVIARAASVEAVRRARVRPDLLGGYAGMGANGGETLVYVWAPAGEASIEARALISDGQAVSEDPATGSACSNLGAWLVAQGRSGRWTVRQGEHVSRPSSLELEVTADGTVTVGGLVRAVGSGEVEL